ncbi:hypothetical protein [Alicyclobacillus sp. SP_1]|jgi:hypothetical protein|uniref:hypothetical protein n=1 Tax=Alicyclobacillus sp. SP_1 TaxID=2942475 RepID=UPI0021589021|nr:hypothetical protein [Alicyclobacillus sp. SP_1]
MDEGYIEVRNQGLRIVGPIHTYHLFSMMLGMGALAPLALVGLATTAFLPHAPGMPFLVALVGLLLGAVLGLVPMPHRHKTVLQWLWLHLKYRMHAQTYFWDRTHRVRTHQARLG